MRVENTAGNYFLSQNSAVLLEQNDVTSTQIVITEIRLCQEPHSEELESSAW